MNVCEEYYQCFAKLLLNQKQKGFFEWMCQNGKSFKGRTLTEKEQEWLQHRISRKLYTPKLCTLQSQVCAIDGELKYFEGQATTKTLGLSLDHAWLVDAEDKVWDPTWKNGEDYFGVEIPASFARDQMLKTKHANFIAYDYYASLHV